MLNVLRGVDLSRISLYFYYIFMDAYLPCLLCECFAKEKQESEAGDED